MDKAALRRRYRAERDKRLRPDGYDQYIRIEGQLSGYLNDPYTPVQERAPLNDHVTFAFIGGGFAGLLAGARLKETGIDDVRIVEKGGGLRRYVVLEPLPGRDVRYRIDGIHAPARGDGSHAERKVRARSGDFRALSWHRASVSAV